MSEELEEKRLDELDGVGIAKLWQVTTWDKRFSGVDKSKQPEIRSFKHVSAAELKTFQTDSDNADVKLLATGQFDGKTTEEIAGDNLNEGEVITVPSGGSANLKYFKGKFVDSGNILGVSADKNVSIKYIYHWLLNNNEVIQSHFRGSGVAHPNMMSILDLDIPIPLKRLNPEQLRSRNDLKEDDKND